MIHLLCPYCRNPIELVKITPEHVVSCPSCGSSFRLAEEATTAWEPRQGQKVGRFAVLETLGHGAFGTVYKAHDPELDRVVALKVPRAGNLAGPEELDRFLREARSVAQLRHPSIVTVHEVTQVEGVPCLVSDFVEGITLADLLSGRQPSPQEAARLSAAIADALQYSHERGVVHRDIKPSNLMIGSDGTPHVMDFGLAKRDAGEITMTLDGAVLGTPAYMSPEQARGESHLVDGRSDVYSLGVILYQTLTGELPFRGTSRMLLYQVLHDDPRRPRSINDRIPRDLETICLKAMAREPGRRYQTAGALAEDLRRCLNGEPILARPMGRLERAVRWARRRPATAALLGVSLLALLALVALGVGYGYNQRLQHAYQDVEQARQEEKTQRKKAEDAAGQLEAHLYRTRIVLAEREWLAGNMERCEQLLDQCPAGERGWEWHYLKRQGHLDLRTLSGHQDKVWTAAFSPDGRHLATASLDGVIKVWDMRSSVELFTVPGETRFSVVYGVAFSPDAQRLCAACADGTVKIWNATTGAKIATLHGHGAPVSCVAFSPDGRHLASGSNDQTVKLWDTMTWKEIMTLPKHGDQVKAVAFRPDGGQLATATGTIAIGPGHQKTGVVRLWDLPIRGGVEEPTARYILRGHTGPVRSLAYSPEGERIVSASYDRTLMIWKTDTGREVRTLRGHAHTVTAVVYSPDGRWLASASDDWTVKVWDPEADLELLTLRGHKSMVLGLACTSDGKRLASASADCTVKIWDPTLAQETLPLRGHASGVLQAAFSQDGRHLASAGQDGTIRVWDALTGQETRTLRGHQDLVPAVAFSPNGQRLVSAGFDGTVRVWELATGQQLSNLKTGYITCAAFSSDGRCATFRQDRGVSIWNIATGQETRNLLGHSGSVLRLAFSPDGQRVASGSTDGTVQLWDIATGQIIRTVLGQTSQAHGMAFSCDGRRLATGGADNNVKVWDLESDNQTFIARGHSHWVFDLAFSPDGRRLASASHDQTVKLWDVESGQELLTLRGHRGTVTSVAFSPDGQRLASAGEDGTIHIWDATPLTDEIRVQREALGVYQLAREKLGLKEEMSASIRDDATVSAAVREQALDLVKVYREDAEHLHVVSRAAVRRADAGVAAYSLALRQAEAAARLAADPPRLAILTMAQHRLGQKEQAQTTLARLREVMQDPRWADNEECQAFQREAEVMLAADPSRSAGSKSG